MSRDYDQRVLVVNDESADERVLVVNGDVVNTTTAAEGDFLARQSGLWVPRKIADADIPSMITRDTELSAAVSAEAALRAAADAGLQPLDSDLSAIAALTTTTFGRSLLTQASASATRATLGAATAYTVLSKTADYTLAAGDWVEGNSTGGAFSLTLPSSPATGNIVGVKKVDSSANAITIVGTIDGVSNPTMTKQWHSYEVIYDGTSWRNLRRPTAAGLVDWPATPDARYLQISNNLSDITAATGRTNLGLGTAATQASTAFDAAGAAAAAQSASQPLDSDLTAIAALATTTFGRSLLTQADAAAALSTLGAAGAGLFKIAEIDVSGSPPANFDIQSIPATYQHLYIVTSLRSDVAATSDAIVFALNNDTTSANYDRQYLRGSAATASASESLGLRNQGLAAGANSAAGLTALNEIFIADYSQTTLFKVARVATMAWTTRSSGGLFAQQGLLGWASTAAINRVTLTPSGGTHWAAGSTISVYGIAAGA